MHFHIVMLDNRVIIYCTNCIYILQVKINFEFKKGVGIAIKSKETSS